MSNTHRAFTHTDAAPEYDPGREQARRLSAEQRAYASPRLSVYGDIARLTMKVGTKGKFDGSGSRRTGF